MIGDNHFGMSEAMSGLHPAAQYQGLCADGIQAGPLTQPKIFDQIVGSISANASHAEEVARMLSAIADRAFGHAELGSGSNGESAIEKLSGEQETFNALTRLETALHRLSEAAKRFERLA